MVVKNNLVVIALVGIPCSGKSTWTEENKKLLSKKYNNAPVIILSKDIIRERIPDYKFPQSEKEVNKIFYKQLSGIVDLDNAVVIIDNTHLKESHLDSYITTFKSLIESGRMKFYIRVFDTYYIRCKIRNIWRNLKTGKFIPFKDMEIMHNNFKKMNLEKYKDYFYE